MKQHTDFRQSEFQFYADLRGYGQSDRPKEVSDYAFPKLIADVAGDHLLSLCSICMALCPHFSWVAMDQWQRPPRLATATHTLSHTGILDALEIDSAHIVGHDWGAGLVSVLNAAD